MSDINDIFEKPPTRIKELIIKSGKKLKEISKEADIPYGALSSYNQGIRTPKKENALKLANYFGVPVSYLLGIEDKEATPLSQKEETEFMLGLIKELEEVQKRAQELARQMDDMFDKITNKK